MEQHIKIITGRSVLFDNGTKLPVVRSKIIHLINKLSYIGILRHLLILTILRHIFLDKAADNIILLYLLIFLPEEPDNKC